MSEIKYFLSRVWHWNKSIITANFSKERSTLVCKDSPNGSSKTFTRSTLMHNASKFELFIYIVKFEVNESQRINGKLPIITLSIKYFSIVYFLPNKLKMCPSVESKRLYFCWLSERKFLSFEFLLPRQSFTLWSKKL